MKINVLAALGALVVLGATACALPEAGAGDVTVAASEAAPSVPVMPDPPTCKGYVNLSFDDGPTASTGRLVDVLKTHNVPAAFFNTGEHTAELPEMIEKQKSVPGAQFGNHTWNHPDLAKLSVPAIIDQIDRTRKVQGEDVTFFRPPFGSAPKPVKEVLADNKMLEVLWTKDSKDFDAKSAEQIVEQSKGMGDGGILLLHDGHPWTIRAVPLIVNHYRSEGFCFGKIAKSATPQVPAESPALTFYAKAVAP